VRVAIAIADGYAWENHLERMSDVGVPETDEVIFGTPEIGLDALNNGEFNLGSITGGLGLADSKDLVRVVGRDRLTGLKMMVRLGEPIEYVFRYWDFFLVCE
jgi:hypothetical protein